MAHSSKPTIYDKLARHFRVTGALLSALLLIMCLAGCTAPQQTHSDTDMVDYYNISEVRAFHKELQTAFTNTALAIETDDKELQNKTIDELENLCAGFIAVKDVPPKLEPYHQKMVEAARQIGEFGQDIKDNKIVEAANLLPNIQALLSEAQAILPSSG